MTSDVKMQNLLTDVTDALLNGEDIEAVRKRHGLSSAQGEDLIDLVKQLNHVMNEVQVSPDFARRLKAELLDERQRGMVWRLRKLPARVQLAGAIAILGGFMLFWRRRLLGEPISEEEKQKEKARLLR